MPKTGDTDHLGGVNSFYDSKIEKSSSAQRLLDNEELDETKRYESVAYQRTVDINELSETNTPRNMLAAGGTKKYQQPGGVFTARRTIGGTVSATDLQHTPINNQKETPVAKETNKGRQQNGAVKTRERK